MGIRLALALATARPVAAQAESRVDPRELMAILFRYAGNPEHDQCRLQPYSAGIERHFGPYRDHAAVALAPARSRHHSHPSLSDS